MICPNCRLVATFDGVEETYNEYYAYWTCPGCKVTFVGSILPEDLEINEG